jgi:hypothetical protein
LLKRPSHLVRLAWNLYGWLDLDVTLDFRIFKTL